MRLEVQDPAELTALDQPQKLAQRRKEPFVGADPEHHTRLAAGVDGAHRVGLFQGQRLLAKDRLSRLGDSDDLVTVQRVRRRQHDRVDAAVGEDRIELADELEPVPGSEVAEPIGVAADRMGEAQPAALALNRLDEGPAPPAETDDRRIDHRPAGSPLGTRGAEMLVEEPKDLVPTVDRLLGAVIRAIVCKERVASPVITVELVVLAEPLQFGLGAVDLIRRRVRILVAEQAQERAIDPFRQIDRRHRLGLGQPRLVVDDDIAAPAIDRALDQMGELAGDEIGLPPAGAEADHADLAAGMRLRAQKVDRTGDIAEHLLVRNAAALAHLADHRLVRAVADPEIEARRHRGITMMSEFAGDLAGPFIPARHVVDHDDTGMRSGIGRVRVIRVASVAVMAAIGRHRSLYVPKRHVDPPSKMPAALFAPNPANCKRASPGNGGKLSYKLTALS